MLATKKLKLKLELKPSSLTPPPSQPAQPVPQTTALVMAAAPAQAKELAPQPFKISPIAPSLPQVPQIPIPGAVSQYHIEGLVDVYGNPISLDEDQVKAVKLAGSNSPENQLLCVVGKAGTGKTTTVQAIALTWLEHDSWHVTSYRQQGTGNRYFAPSIAIVAATNMAANNMAARLVSHKKLGSDGYGFGPNITTCHNLLEYTVEWIIDPETGNKKPRYYPKKEENNKLDITHLVLEEATLVGASQEANHFNWEQLRRALPSGVKILFLGDINQLPPVIGKSILNYAVQQLPKVELTQVHRQALDNPIIRQALNCIEGRPIVEDFNPDTMQGVRIFNGKAKFKLSMQQYEFGFKKLMEKQIECGQFDPMVDMILSPYNKIAENAVSSQNLAAVIATLLSSKSPNKVYEIQAGFTRLYLRVGDRVFIDKKEGIVSKIEHNSSYYGRSPQPASHTLDYFGKHSNQKRGVEDLATDENDELWDSNYTHLSIEELLLQGDVGEEERKRAGSHLVTIAFKVSNNDPEDDSPSEEREVTYSSVGELSGITLGYALSVHKSQGSEWPRVVLALHESNRANLFRELVYTAMTRPRERLDIIAQQYVIDKAVASQRIKGHTLEAKIEFFNSGYLDQEIEIGPTAD